MTPRFDTPEADRLPADLTAARAALQAVLSREERRHRLIAAAYARSRQDELRRVQAETALAAIRGSSIWRLSLPLRAVLSVIPESVRRWPLQALSGAWRLVAPGWAAVLPAPDDPLPDEAPHEPLRLATPPAGLHIVYISGEPDTPGSVYRVRRYAEACRTAGARVTELRLGDVAADRSALGWIDILVVWRAVWSEPLSRLVGQVRAEGGRVVFDVDDLMIDPALATAAIIDGIRSQDLAEGAVRSHYAAVQRTMLAADLCTASTAELAGHMRRFGKPSLVLPNGFDDRTLQASRMAARRRRAAPPDGLLRIGYAGGSRTHQRDFAEIAGVLPGILHAHPNCRLVLFQAADGQTLVDLREFPALAACAAQVEWRPMVTLDGLPAEVARFDVNLAPLQSGNVFCEAKSELKYFEAALAGVCTVASPTGPYRRAIRPGVTGFLAADAAEWRSALTRLLGDPALRAAMAGAALHDVLWAYGPERRAQLMRRVLAEWQGGPAAADAFLLEGAGRSSRPALPDIPGGEVVFARDALRPSEVTVVVPLYNYAHTVAEALDSVAQQTLGPLDLVIVDDRSVDDSLGTAVSWARAHAGRFNRLIVVRNDANAGLGPTRNAGFAAAETRFVLPLDADNRLRPGCCEALLAAIQQSGADFAYPVIQEFGGRTGRIGRAPYDPRRLVGGNAIDAMALVAKSAWCAAGGYAPMRQGWEDYDFWCALAENGLFGLGVGGPPLAEYRVHPDSMLANLTDTRAGKAAVIAAVEARHRWVSVARELGGPAGVEGKDDPEDAMHAQMPDPVPIPGPIPVNDPPPGDVPPLEVPPGGEPVPTPIPAQLNA